MKLQLLHPIAGLTDRPLSVAEAGGAASTSTTAAPVTPMSTPASPANSLRLTCGRIRSSHQPLFPLHRTLAGCRDRDETGGTSDTYPGTGRAGSRAPQQPRPAVVGRPWLTGGLRMSQCDAGRCQYL